MATIRPPTRPSRTRTQSSIPSKEASLRASRARTIGRVTAVVLFRMGPFRVGLFQGGGPDPALGS